MRPRRAHALLATLVAVLGVAALAPHAAHADVTVEIVQPADGAVVSGVVSVAARASAGTTSVAFDWTQDEGATWTPISTDTDGADGWRASWDTAGTSGPAQVRATAGDGITTGQDTVSVTVDDAPPAVVVAAAPNPFSPNGNGMKDTTTITAQADGPALITIRLLDAAGAARRSWPPVLAPTGVRTIVYGGRDDQNRPLPGALYTLQVTASDPEGASSTTASTPLRIDLGFPSASWVGVWPEPVSNQTFVSFTYTAWDRAELLNVELHLYDRVGPVGAPLLGLVRERGQRTLKWSPRYRGGELLFPGAYRARVRVEDDAGNVTWTGYRRWRVLRPVTAKVFRRLDAAGNRVALTFDDCYSSAGWSGVLDQLAAAGRKGTFFCSGPVVDDFPGLARRTRDAGHTIGSHGWDHLTMSGRTYTDQQQRMLKDRNIWWDVASETTAPYFRPPYGSYDSNTLAAAGNTAHPRVVLWDVDPADYTTSSSSLIASRVLSAVKPGSIVVLHALPQTAGALPAILDGLADKGLTPVSLADLFRFAGYH